MNKYQIKLTQTGEMVFEIEAWCHDDALEKARLVMLPNDISRAVNVPAIEKKYEIVGAEGYGT